MLSSHGLNPVFFGELSPGKKGYNHNVNAKQYRSKNTSLFCSILILNASEASLLTFTHACIPL